MTTTKAKTPKASKPKTTKKTDAPKQTVHERLEVMLRREGGATIEAIQSEFNILPHSARALISTLGKKLGGTIKGERAEKGQPLVYRLPAAD